MTILDWFDILLDGIARGIDWLMSIDLGGISLGNYIVVIFVTGLLITLFLNVVNTGAVMGRRIARRKKDGNE